MKYLVVLLLCISFMKLYSQSPFFVQKQDVIHALYRNCVNDLWINTPDMCEEISFRLTISDATFWQDSINKRHIKVIPRGNHANIEIVYYDGNGKTVNSTTRLDVMDIPIVNYRFEIDGKPAVRDEKIDIQSKLTLTLEPDLNFEKNLPNECDYRLNEIEIYVSNENYPPQHVKKLAFDIHQPQSTLDISLPETCFSKGSGSKIMLEIHEFYRLNSQGELVYVDWFPSIFDRSYTFIVK